MTTPREQLLDEAKGYVTKDRQAAYDEPENNFGRISGALDALGYGHKNRTLQPYDVAIILNVVKLARLSYNPTHKDSWVDTAGYAACGWDCVVAAKAKEETDPVTSGVPYSEPSVEEYQYGDPVYTKPVQIDPLPEYMDANGNSVPAAPEMMYHKECEACRREMGMNQ